MSLKHTEKLTCPGCGKEQDFTVWQSINVTEQPELKQQLLEREFFKFICPDCGHTGEVNYACLYHDMDKQLMIFFSPDDDYEEAVEQLNQSQEALQKQFPDVDGYYTLRVVTSINDLVEKIKIFDAQKDDRLLEMCKIFVVANLGQQQPDFQVHQIYFDQDETGEDLFVLFNEEGATVSCAIPQQFYEGVSKAFVEKMPVEQTPFYKVIDNNWALEILGEYK